MYVCKYIMSVCLYFISTYLYMYMSMSMHLYLYLQMYMYICIYAYIYVYIYVYVYICICICVYVYVYVYVYMYMYMYTYVYMFLFIYPISYILHIHLSIQKVNYTILSRISPGAHNKQQNCRPRCSTDIHRSIYIYTYLCLHPTDAAGLPGSPSCDGERVAHMPGRL